MAWRRFGKTIGLALLTAFAAGCHGPILFRMRTTGRFQTQVVRQPTASPMITQRTPVREPASGIRASDGGFESLRRSLSLCPPGFEFDPHFGACFPPQPMMPVASNPGGSIGQPQELGCPPGEQVVVEGKRSTCKVTTCARDEVWDGQACRAAAKCSPGRHFDPPSGWCISMAAEGDAKKDSNEYDVDLSTWVRTSYGPDGGEGAPGFCGAFDQHPSAFGVRAGTTQHVKVDVHVEAPEGDIARATTTTQAMLEPSGKPAPAKGATEVSQAAQATLASLVATGGKSKITVASTTVTCRLVNQRVPSASVSGGV